MKLISMTDFVLEQTKDNNKQRLYKYSDIVCYAKFLNQPLKLEMFVSKNEENILFNGFEFMDSQKHSVNNNIKLSVSPYGLNNERLLLTKLNEQNKFHTWFQLFTIEDLIQCDLKLTPNAIKRIFG